MIGILNAYHFDTEKGSYQETYNEDIKAFITRAFQGEPIQEYKIAQDQWPESYDECRVWVITGSAKSAYDEEPWIKKLIECVQQLHQQKKKLIGICFGHQVIAVALGGKVEKSPKSWGVGVKPFQVTHKKDWMKPPKESLSLLFSHQDQVVKLPDGAEHLAADDFCPYQIFQVGQHILSMQGHPEFTPEFAKQRLLSRKDKLESQLFETALASFSHERDDQTVGKWMLEFARRS